MREKKKQKSKIEIVDKKRFFTAISVCLIFIIIIIIIIVCVSNGNKGDSSLSSMDASKNVKELLSKYEASGMKEEFIKDYNEIQSKVGIYIMNNVTTDNSSFNNIVSDLNNVLKSNDWSKINLSKNDTWNGVWSLDKDGNLKFKFSLKKIEPSWVNEIELRTKLYLN